jgi:hypothetical protein
VEADAECRTGLVGMFTHKEIAMLFSSQIVDKTLVGGAANAATADAGKIVLGGGFRLPATTADAGKIVLGGGFRLPAATADAGKIVLGGGFRLPARAN